jgi:hypothetical protein
LAKVSDNQFIIRVGGLETLTLDKFADAMKALKDHQGKYR